MANTLYKIKAESPEKTLFFKTIIDAAKHFGMTRHTLRFKINNNKKFSHKRLLQSTNNVKFRTCYMRKSGLIASGGKNNHNHIILSRYFHLRLSRCFGLGMMDLSSQNHNVQLSHYEYNFQAVNFHRLVQLDPLRVSR